MGFRFSLVDKRILLRAAFCGSLVINIMEFLLRMTDSVLFYKHKKFSKVRAV